MIASWLVFVAEIAMDGIISLLLLLLLMGVLPAAPASYEHTLNYEL